MSVRDPEGAKRRFLRLFRIAEYSGAAGLAVLIAGIPLLVLLTVLQEPVTFLPLLVFFGLFMFWFMVFAWASSVIDGLRFGFWLRLKDQSVGGFVLGLWFGLVVCVAILYSSPQVTAFVGQVSSILWWILLTLLVLTPLVMAAMLWSTPEESQVQLWSDRKTPDEILQAIRTELNAHGMAYTRSDDLRILSLRYGPGVSICDGEVEVVIRPAGNRWVRYSAVYKRARESTLARRIEVLIDEVLGDQGSASAKTP